MSLCRDAVRARGLPRERRRLLVEAVIWLGLLRAAVAVLPYRWVARLLRLTPSDPSQASLAHCAGGVAGGGGPHDAGAAGGPGAEAIGWAVRSAAAHTPWLSACLVQSLAGYAVLRRHDLAGVVYLGVARDARGEFIAHSWLRCGADIVTGASGHQRYSVIAAYRPALGAHR